ncbi:hypothetical protein FJT64_027301 [Amphibalanus amphitrite]|uniref:Uncharacterized protein n=1 Tax=Amphibalanus amphitrite TaxID=1232801 RepID=A0A6A4W8M7_AMPAM|nr:hypothetical protein FJT64_027301 [Amphibalanus amphitrite]
MHSLQAPTDRATQLGHEFGAMLAGMPEDFLRMVISRRRAGGGGADDMFKILTDMEARLSQLSPGALERFTDYSSRSVQSYLCGLCPVRQVLTEMEAALRLDESLQRARHTDDRWRHLWQVDELVHMKPLKDRSFAYDLDLVLSIPGVAWPDGALEAYRSRQQFTGCVNRSMVQRLTATKLYMVAAGFKRSPSAEAPVALFLLAAGSTC